MPYGPLSRVPVKVRVDYYLIEEIQKPTTEKTKYSQKTLYLTGIRKSVLTKSKFMGV